MPSKSKSRRTPVPNKANIELSGAVPPAEEIRLLRQELERSQDALDQSEDCFTNLFTISTMGYQSLDENGCFIDVNSAWLDMLGYTRDEVIGKRFSDFLVPEMVDRFLKRFPRFKAAGSIHSEFQMFHNDGSRHLIEIEGRIGHNTDGSFKQTHCILSDLTERNKVEEAALNSDEKRQRLFETMNEGVFYQLADGTHIDVNNAALRMFGITRDDFLNRTSLHSKWDVIREDGTPISGAEHPSMKVLSTGKPLHDMVVGIRNFQTKVYTWVSVSGIPEFLEGESTPYQAVITMHDLTERKQAEQELSESELRYKRIQQISKTGSWEYNFDSDIFWASDEALQIYAFDSQNAPFTADLVESCIPERERVHQALVDLIEEDRKYDLEFEIHPYDGSAPRIVSSMAECLRDNQGKAVKVIGAILDITERKQAETEILSLSRFPSENPNPVLRIHRDGALLFANDAATDLLRFWNREIGESAPDIWKEKIAAAFTANSIIETELKFDGRILSFELVPVSEEDYVNLYGQDITQRKLAEKEHQEQFDELRHWHAAMLGREARMQELKHEINLLLIEAGKPIRFSSVEAK